MSNSLYKALVYTVYLIFLCVLQMYTVDIWLDAKLHFKTCTMCNNMI